MQFFNVLEKKCYRVRAAAATASPPPRQRWGRGGSGSAAMDISVLWLDQNSDFRTTPPIVDEFYTVLKSNISVTYGEENKPRKPRKKLKQNDG